MILPDKLLAAIRDAERPLILTGAGVSRESGIPTFRDALSGLWARFDAERLATPEAFAADPALVWGWYEWRRALVLGCRPNAAHEALADWGRRVPGLTLVTQNVDGLHERAGSRDLVALHGSLHRPRCADCGRPHTLSAAVPDLPEGGARLWPPACTVCGGLIRPGVVWFGEQLPEAALERAMRAAAECDLCLSIGTSALVYPAAQLPLDAAARGVAVIQINPEVTPLDGVATWSLRGPAARLLPDLLARAWKTMD